ncbi:MAG: hypothetical protein K8F24_10440 [Bacteroidales bacterium]|nr:hypothetical protein [Bacteroidales bacterium]
MRLKNIFVGFFAGLLLLAALSSCNTDVDLYADYEEIVAVYGLLDSDQDTTFIKITKAFSGPGNALLMAKDPDSSNFANKLDVQLTGRKNSIDLPPIVLDTITIHNKLAGDSVFYFPNQLLYYTTATLDADASYDLVINRNDKQITSNTDMVKSFGITKPGGFVFNFTATMASQIEWRSAVDGRRYEVILTFHYQELRPGNPDTLNKTMDWYLGTRTSGNLEGGQNMSVSYLGENFYKRLGQQIDDELNVKRWAGDVVITISAGGEELNTFIDVNAPSNSIIQEVPQYTNIDGGTGIFSSRRTISRSYKLLSTSEDKLINDYDWGFRRVL